MIDTLVADEGAPTLLRNDWTLAEVEALCFLAGADSIFCGEKLLTTPNPAQDEDMMMLERLGLRPDRIAEAAADLVE